MRTLTCLAFLVVVCAMALPAGATVVYQSAPIDGGNSIPLANDGTPGHPDPGNYIGNQVTLAGTDRDVTNVSEWFGCDDPVVQTPNFTCQLYANDGLGGAPGTLLGSSTVSATSVPFSNWLVSFPFADVAVPDSFTFVFSSTAVQGVNVGMYGPGYTGVANADGPGSIGSALNTVWYLTDSGWVNNNSWAITDGGQANYFGATITAEAVPEPVTMLSLFAGLTGLGAWVRRRAAKS